MHNQPMSEEEVVQIIMCQYPEEETAEGSVTQEQAEEPVKILPVTTQVQSPTRFTGEDFRFVLEI